MYEFTESNNDILTNDNVSFPLLSYSYNADLVLGPPDFYPAAAEFPPGYVWITQGPGPHFLEVS